MLRNLLIQILLLIIFGFYFIWGLSDPLDFWVLSLILFPIIFLWGLAEIIYWLMDNPRLFIAFSLFLGIFPSLFLGSGEIEINNIIFHLLCLFVFYVSLFLIMISIGHYFNVKDNEKES